MNGHKYHEFYFIFKLFLNFNIKNLYIKIELIKYMKII